MCGLHGVKVMANAMLNIGEGNVQWILQPWARYLGHESVEVMYKKTVYMLPHHALLNSRFYGSTEQTLSCEQVKVQNVCFYII